MRLIPLLFILSISSQFVFAQTNADTNGTCTAECATSLNATLSCETVADPFCGCSDFLAGAPTCRDCLANTNTTLIGFFNASYVNFIVGVCNCQRPSCGDLINVEKECALADPNNQACHCPATLVDGPDCYGCLKGFINDTFVLNGLDATLAFCQQALSNSSSSTSSAYAGPSSSASASTSQNPPASATQSAHNSSSASVTVGQSSLPSNTSGAEWIGSEIFGKFWKMWCAQFMFVTVLIGAW